jgi:hypothetical protein
MLKIGSYQARHADTATLSPGRGWSSQLLNPCETPISDTDVGGVPLVMHQNDCYVLLTLESPSPTERSPLESDRWRPGKLACLDHQDMTSLLRKSFHVDQQ